MYLGDDRSVVTLSIKHLALLAACFAATFWLGHWAARGPEASSVAAGVLPSVTRAVDIERVVEAAVSREVEKRVEALNVDVLARGGGKVFPVVAELHSLERKRILVTGGAGFVGSHLVDALMRAGHVVYVIDNFFTGRKENVEQWLGHKNFELIQHDVVEHFMIEVDQIYHLACPASPPHYQANPIKTIKTSVEGTMNMLGLAKRVRARILLTSTSEVYGDPLVHPQNESYHGNVNPIGPRACYDEGKRAAETLMYAYQKQEHVDVRVARIFNTFGPRMHPNDGRVVSNFIIQALQGKELTMYGDGSTTRSFQYVDDLVRGLIALMNGSYSQPVNIGNPEEFTIRAFAEMIVAQVGSSSSIVSLPKTKDDPSRRRPDITVASRELGWRPLVDVRSGLAKTIEYFRAELQKTGEFSPIQPEELRGG